MVVDLGYLGTRVGARMVVGPLPRRGKATD